jgi:murein DD-endopeptidase MepM/ murein hydrolase activator NlpD
MAMRRFPLPKDANYDYANRFGTSPGDHHGTDIFAPRGTPVLAVERGMARSAEDPKGGLVVYLAALNLDGGPAEPVRMYYYAHLDDTIDPVPGGTLVEPGEVIGHVGDSGNAKGGDPHLHFQARIAGETVNPYPLLRGVDPKVPGPGKDPIDLSPTAPPPVVVGLGVIILAGLAWLAFGNRKRGRRRAAA